MKIYYIYFEDDEYGHKDPEDGKGYLTEEAAQYTIDLSSYLFTHGAKIAALEIQNEN